MCAQAHINHVRRSEQYVAADSSRIQHVSCIDLLTLFRSYLCQNNVKVFFFLSASWNKCIYYHLPLLSELQSVFVCEIVVVVCVCIWHILVP